MPDDSTFITVRANAEASLSVQGSRFVSQIHPVAMVEEADQVIDTVAETYADATHIVPAYRIRVSNDAEYVREWSSDAGEPNGTAGPPVLNVLTQRNLVNVVVVIARFYGGTNLGTGGLHRAYARATVLAIDAAPVIPLVPTTTYEIRVPYDDSGTIRSILESKQVEFDATYDETVTFTITIAEESVDAVIDRIQSATHGEASITNC